MRQAGTRSTGRNLRLGARTPGGTLADGEPETAAGGPRARVIFISAYDRAETLARALDAGADDYLVRPFSATELTALVRAALRRGPRARARRLGPESVTDERGRTFE